VRAERPSPAPDPSALLPPRVGGAPMDPASRAAARRLGLGLALAASLALACASRPVVYVDPAADAARRARVERDIDECRSYAKTHTREGLAGTGDAARSTVRGGAVGAAAGAVGGAIW